MDSKDVRILVKKVLMRKKFIKATDLKSDTWTADDASAWKNFCYSIPGFSVYSGKIPNEVSISVDHLKVLKGLISGERKVEEPKVTEEFNATPSADTLPTEEQPATEEVISEDPNSVEEAPALEEEVVEEVAEVEENSTPEEEVVEEAPAKKSGKKNKK